MNRELHIIDRISFIGHNIRRHWKNAVFLLTVGTTATACARPGIQETRTSALPAYTIAALQDGIRGDCGSPVANNYILGEPALDPSSENVLEIIDPVTNQGNFWAINSVVEKRHLPASEIPGYFQQQINPLRLQEAYGPRMDFNKMTDWLYRSGMPEITSHISNYLTGVGDPLLRDPNNWSTIVSTSAPEIVAQHQQVLARIAQGEIANGTINIEYVGNELWQKPGTNILRSIWGVRDTTNGQLYFIKIQHMDTALPEVRGATLIQRYAPEIKVVSETILQPASANRLTVTISDAIPGIPLTDLMGNMSSLSQEAQMNMRSQLARLYQANEMAWQTEGMITRDLFRTTGNIFVDTNGNITVLEGQGVRVSGKIVQAADGTSVIRGAAGKLLGRQGRLLADNYGVTPELLRATQPSTTTAITLPPGAQTEISVVTDAGTTTPMHLANPLTRQITVPRTISARIAGLYDVAMRGLIAGVIAYETTTEGVEMDSVNNLSVYPHIPTQAFGPDEETLVLMGVSEQNFHTFGDLWRGIVIQGVLHDITRPDSWGSADQTIALAPYEGETTFQIPAVVCAPAENAGNTHIRWAQPVVNPDSTMTTYGTGIVAEGYSLQPFVNFETNFTTLTGEIAPQVTNAPAVFSILEKYRTSGQILGYTNDEKGRLIVVASTLDSQNNQVIIFRYLVMPDKTYLGINLTPKEDGVSFDVTTTVVPGL